MRNPMGGQGSSVEQHHGSIKGSMYSGTGYGQSYRTDQEAGCMEDDITAELSFRSAGGIIIDNPSGGADHG